MPQMHDTRQLMPENVQGHITHIITVPHEKKKKAIHMSTLHRDLICQVSSKSVSGDVVCVTNVL